MEGSKVEKNQKSNESWAISLNSLVIKYFKANLPSFELTNKTSHGPFWGVTYSEGDIEIRIGGDIGFGIDIIIDKKEYHLWQYDRSVNSAMDTTEKNILYQLDVLKKFLG